MPRKDRLGADVILQPLGIFQDKSNRPSIQPIPFIQRHSEIGALPNESIPKPGIKVAILESRYLQYRIGGLYEPESSKSVISALAMSFASPLSLISLSSLTTPIPLSLRPSSTASNNAWSAA